MRSLSLKSAALIAGLFGLPMAASAQTAADIGRQVWPLGVPSAEGTSPSQLPDAGGGSPRDIARQVWPLGAPASESASPAHYYTGGKLSGRYLARLRDGFPPWLPGGSAAFTIARRD